MSRSSMNCGKFTDGWELDVQIDLRVDKINGVGFRNNNSWGVNPCLELGVFLEKWRTKSNANGQSCLFSIHLASITLRVK